jgi:septal ring factor EnvC (AmiA/AmiB activator)
MNLRRLALFAVFTTATLVPLTARQLQAQDATSRIRAQRDTLDRIRREREDLERRSAELQNSVHDLSEEVSNLNHRREVSTRLVKAIDAQLAVITDEVDSATIRVSTTESELTHRKTALQKRLVDIYERGPLNTAEVLLSAHSFGDLIARYKYLHLLTLRDRSLVSRVQALRDQLQQDRDRLVGLQTALEESRADKKREEDKLRELQHERVSSLAQTKQQVQQTEDRLTRLKATETQLTNTIASLDAERRRAESARPSATKGAAASPASTIKTSDYGKLDWPVEGALVYTFGKAQTASNATIRWNGVGIKAPVGTAVRSVAPGKIVSVGPLGTYGLTVIIDHGGGDYSIYGSLSHSDVKQLQSVIKGQVIGEVGVSDPDLPAHLHFEIRHGGADGRPASVDPATWLRDQR